MRKPPTITELAEAVAAGLGSAPYTHRQHVKKSEASRSAELFTEFAGFDVPSTSVTDTMLDMFSSWLDASGKNPRHRSVVAGLVDGACPDAKLRRTGRHMQERRREIVVIEGSLWELFLTKYAKRNRSAAATERQYRVQLNHLAQWLGHEPMLDDLSDDRLAEFMHDHSQGRSVPTVNKAYWCIVALWRRAFDLGMIKTRPTVQPLVEPEQVPFAWLKEEVEALLRACDKVHGTVCGIPANLWWVSLHWFIWSTGERIGAVLGVKKTDVNLSRGEAFVPAEIRKGRRKPKLYKLLPQAVDALRQADEIDRQLLFPWPYDVVMLYYRYKKILKAAGLPTDRKCKFHRMRRSFASYIEAAGGNATAALGHSARRVAEKSYLDPRICGSQNPAELLPSLAVSEPAGGGQ